MRKYPLEAYRRRLPHWRMDGATYLLNWRLHESQKTLEPPERTIVVSSLKHFDGKWYDLLAYVVMPDHVHALVRPHADHPLEKIVHSWKSYTAH